MARAAGARSCPTLGRIIEPVALLMRYIKESRLAAPPEVVFRFHESPEALRRLIPPWERMEVVESSGSLAPGSRVVLAGRIGPVPVRWVAVHTEYDPPHGFADRQESGPFARWHHRHRFLDDGRGGTVLRDEIDYEPPFGALGRWAGGWFIRRQLEKMFTYRHDVTRQIVESHHAPGEPPPAASRARGHE